MRMLATSVLLMERCFTQSRQLLVITENLQSRKQLLVYGPRLEVCSAGQSWLPQPLSYQRMLFLPLHPVASFQSLALQMCLPCAVREAARLAPLLSLSWMNAAYRNSSQVCPANCQTIRPPFLPRRPAWATTRLPEELELAKKHGLAEMQGLVEVLELAGVQERRIQEL